jgi:hypothetical protein
MAKNISDVIKKKGETGGKSNKPGKGGRFKQMEKKGLSDKLIAWIGRKNHGSKEMGKWSAEGRKKK